MAGIHYSQFGVGTNPIIMNADNNRTSPFINSSLVDVR